MFNIENWIALYHQKYTNTYKYNCTKSIVGKY
jgi:hypothetical protein